MAESRTAKNESKGLDFGKCLKDTFGAVKAVFVKPASEGAKAIDIKDPKAGWIKNAILLVTVEIINLINTVLGLIIVKTKSFSGFSSKGINTETKVEFKFDNITSINYFEVIGKSLLMTAIFVLVVAGVSYLVGMLMKKQANIVKLAGAVLLGLIPMAVCGILATLVAMFWTEGAIFVTMAGLVFGLAIMINIISKEMALEGDKLIFFHLATILVVALVYYFIILKNEFFAEMLGIGELTTLLSMVM